MFSYRFCNIFDEDDDDDDDDDDDKFFLWHGWRRRQLTLPEIFTMANLQYAASRIFRALFFTEHLRWRHLKICWPSNFRIHDFFLRRHFYNSTSNICGGLWRFKRSSFMEQQKQSGRGVMRILSIICGSFWKPPSCSFCQIHFSWPLPPLCRTCGQMDNKSCIKWCSQLKLILIFFEKFLGKFLSL